MTCEKYLRNLYFFDCCAVIVVDHALTTVYTINKILCIQYTLNDVGK